MQLIPEMTDTDGVSTILVKVANPKFLNILKDEYKKLTAETILLVI